MSLDVIDQYFCKNLDNFCRSGDQKKIDPKLKNLEVNK